MHCFPLIDTVGMPVPQRKATTIFSGGSGPSTQTILFKGSQVRSLDDGLLLRIYIYRHQTTSIDLQVWRPTGTANEYTLKFTTAVTGAANTIQEVDVETSNFQILFDDVIGVSFSGASPIPMYDVSCIYINMSDITHTQDSVLTTNSYESTLETPIVFTDGGICKDYHVYALVRYYCKLERGGGGAERGREAPRGKDSEERGRQREK